CSGVSRRSWADCERRLVFDHSPNLGSAKGGSRSRSDKRGLDLKLDNRVRLALMLGAIGCSRHPTSCGARSTTSPSAATSAEVAKILNAELPAEDAGDATDGEAFIELVRR